MDLITLRSKYKKQILEIAKRRKVKNIRVFGSIVRGEENKNSDIDFLVQVKPKAGFNLGGMYWELKELLGCEVDVVPETSIHWYLKDQILNEAQPL